MDKQTLIDNLNKDLAGELGAIIQYITYAAKATGPYRPQLAAFFLQEVADIFRTTPYIADLKPGGRYVAKDLFEVGGVELYNHGRDYAADLLPQPIYSYGGRAADSPSDRHPSTASPGMPKAAARSRCCPSRCSEYGSVNGFMWRSRKDCSATW